MVKVQEPFQMPGCIDGDPRDARGVDTVIVMRLAIHIRRPG